MLGIAVGNTTWLLATSEIAAGGNVPVCSEPFFGRPATPGGTATLPRVENVRTASEIHYWGHYPVVDMEYVTDCPVSTGLRAWAPFIPGDSASSNMPAMVFEIHLRNTTSHPQEGRLVFNFPGPDQQEAMGNQFTRIKIHEDSTGVLVKSNGGVSYFVGTLGSEKIWLGPSLGPNDWSHVPTASETELEHLEELCQSRVDHGGTSLGVNFALDDEEEKVIRIVVAWHAPVWKGAERDRVELLQSHYAGGAKTFWRGSEWDSENHYRLMYATRYTNALDVAREIAKEHSSLLRRIIAWQNVLYRQSDLPIWLRDSLINSLALLAEDSVWVEPQEPIGQWAFPGGAFGMIESPRGDSDLACIPCDWYGNIPIVYFFPELAKSTLRAFKQFQREDGAAPFWLGVLGDLPDFLTPSYEWQISLNGTCYVDMVDRLWQRTGDDSVLREFYDSAKKCNTKTMGLRKGPGGVISMPEGNKGMEWFEHGEWAGMCAHLGGLHLAQLRMMHRMAEHMHDAEYVDQCNEWLADGTRAMENELWNGSYYLNFLEKESNKKSDDVMAYQLDGQWAARYHGLPDVFRPDRAKTALEKIRHCNIALTPNVGAANFSRSDGGPIPAASKIAEYGPYAMFPAEVLVLAMTYIYSEQAAVGLDLARKHWENIACKHGHAWDMPNIVRGDTGTRVYGTDYYQSLMLWALPDALARQDIAAASKPGGLIDRILLAGNG